MMYPLAQPESRCRFKGFSPVWVLVCLLALGACTEIKPLGPKISADSDTGDADWETAGIMPNDYGFIINDAEASLHLQGAWYWYDSSVDEAKVDEVYVLNHKGDTYYWHGGENPDVEHLEIDRKVSQICVEGETNEYLAIGFETCSTRDDESPYEFPFPLGNCFLVDENEKGVRYFKGVEFMLESEAFSRLEVQFKQWGAPDDFLPFCAYVVNEDDYGEKEERCKVEPLGDGRIKVTADALEAKIWKEDLTLPDKGVWIPLKLEMLQAIHLQVYPVAGERALDFCLSDLVAFGNSKPLTEPVEIFEPDECAPPKTTADTDFQNSFDWVPVAPENKDENAFEILRSEVTVEQYTQCSEDICDRTKFKAWESCHLYRYEYDQYENETVALKNRKAVGNRAVNCVPWCQARIFCQWIGGELPTEKQWIAAAKADNPEAIYPDGIADDNDIDCDHIVMNDEETGVGCGLGDLPAPVCSKVKVPLDETTQLCDMAGNLWEWVQDDADEIAGEPWRAKYKKIKGGSFNSTEGSKAFLIDESTIEHPSVPHSPTRLGFRCVRPVTVDDPKKR